MLALLREEKGVEAMKHLSTLATVALLTAAMLASPTAARAEDLSIDPSSWDYGEVALGTPSTHSFTFTSIGVSAVWIYLVQVTPGESEAVVCGTDVACDFAITSSPRLPIELPPGENVVVEVTFTPSAIGSGQAFLEVVSNDSVPPPGVISYLPLAGVGVEPGPDPAALMTDLLEFFGDAVDAGTLWGVGPGSSARHRLDAFRSQLIEAAGLIDRNADASACIVLQAARAKADGEPRPPDFVAGPATDELVTRIDDVRAALGCRPRICQSVGK